MVVTVPFPLVVVPPGFWVRVQVPEAGNPLNDTLPVATRQVGWVFDSTTGAEGRGGAELITTPEDEPEVQPAELVTVKVQVPVGSPVRVVVEPVPGVVIAPGLRVRVQLPDDGNPLRFTLPVGSSQSGWVISPTKGTPGVGGCVLIVTLDEDTEVQPSSLVTVNVQFPAGKPVRVVEIPLPVVLIPPGFRVTVQSPEEGRPFRVTLPVATSQSGCIVSPIDGAAGTSGGVLMFTLEEVGDVHPASLVTVKVQDPSARPVMVVVVPLPVV